MNILLTGYTYTRKNLFEVFDSYPEKENLYFILPNNWHEKGGKVVYEPMKKEGFNIYHSRAFFFHSHYPLIGGLFKGWMPFFVFRFIWLRFTTGIDILYTTGEVNLLGTLYNAIWANLLGVKHVFNCWENIPYEQKDKGLKLIFKRWIIKANIALSDGALCGQKKAEQILRSFSKDIIITQQLHAGFNEELFKPGLEPKIRNKFNLQGKFVFLFVGALGYRKGIHLIIEALNELRKKYNDIHFLMVGSGEYEEKLKLQVASYKLQDFVTFIPWMANEELPDVYNSADVFLYPSISYQGWEEQFGYSIAEASLCGLPVISTKTGGIDEVMIDGKTGIMVSPESVPELKIAMEKMINSNDLRRDFGQNGRAFIIENYSNRIIAGRMFNFFKKVYGSK